MSSECLKLNSKCFVPETLEVFLDANLEEREGAPARNRRSGGGNNGGGVRTNNGMNSYGRKRRATQGLGLSILSLTKHTIHWRSGSSALAYNHDIFISKDLDN